MLLLVSVKLEPVTWKISFKEALVTY